MTVSHDIFYVTKKLATDLGCTMADLASAIGRSQSAIQRTLDGNPTVKMLKEVAWALGLQDDAGDPGGNYHWLCVSKSSYELYKGTAFRLNREAPIVLHRAHRMERRQYAPDESVLDRSKLATMYPTKAVQGAGDRPLDTRYVVTEDHLPQSPFNPSTQSAVQGSAQPSPKPYRPQVQAPADLASMEDVEQRRERLSLGCPVGHQLSDAALGVAPRTPYSHWVNGGWTPDKMREHGYLETAPVAPLPPSADTDDWDREGESTGQATKPRAPTPPGHTSSASSQDVPEREVLRQKLSRGCPAGWILSDVALEADDTVSYKGWRDAGLTDQQMKDRNYLVPRAWLGYADNTKEHDHEQH